VAFFWGFEIQNQRRLGNREERAPSIHLPVSRSSLYLCLICLICELPVQRNIHLCCDWLEHLYTSVSFSSPCFPLAGATGPLQPAPPDCRTAIQTVNTLDLFIKSVMCTNLNHTTLIPSTQHNCNFFSGCTNKFRCVSNAQRQIKSIIFYSIACTVIKIGRASCRA